MLKKFDTLDDNNNKILTCANTNNKINKFNAEFSKKILTSILNKINDLHIILNDKNTLIMTLSEELKKYYDKIGLKNKETKILFLDKLDDINNKILNNYNDFKSEININ